MSTIHKFTSEPFISALKLFFDELHIPINYIDDKPAKPEIIFSEKYNPNNASHQLIDDVYAVGIVDDNAFKNVSTITESDANNADYDYLLIIGMTLKTENGKLPNRSHLSELTRLANKAFNSNEKGNPVTVVFRYDNYITFANAERVSRNSTDYHEGEKIGKVSMLKDIDLSRTHRAHHEILSELIINKTKINSFSKLYNHWQTIFSISALNTSFYLKIVKWFNLAVNNIRIPSQNHGSEKHKDFTVRLIARLIFIWFLKELKVIKEELLVPEFFQGEDNALIKPKKDNTDLNTTNYYKFILQNLFFNALNQEHKIRNINLLDVHSSSFENIDEIKKYIDFSPYLSGGLFEVHIPNDYFVTEKENNEYVYKINNDFRVPDFLFLDKENGLNSILSHYKFTVAENTPLEEEIAVDPEMLGRIFENLLAEQSDDTKEAARKNAGAFYTPRPVVSYMCRNTLLQHLNIEITPENSKQIINKLLNTTVLDPACGSGAFPIGMLEEMMQVLSTVDPEGKVWVSEMMKSKDEEFREHISEMYADGQIRYIKKLGLLRNCLFGVDILEYAIEISKLRCWLSLIVEQKVDFSKDNYNLKPLPNLEFKFYKKNSLFRHYKNRNINQLIDAFDKEGLLKELVDLENRYFIAKSDKYNSKEEIKEKIISLLEKIVDDNTNSVQINYRLAKSQLDYLINTGAIATKIQNAKTKVTRFAIELGELAQLLETLKDYFIERIVFPGIFNKDSDNPGFDIVIGNPPYVNTKLINKMGISKKIEEEYGYCDDLYNHFTIRGLELLKKGGHLSYITSDTFLTLQTKQNMRMEFLGINKNNNSGTLNFEEQSSPICRILEIINTPKAFAALVDTAIFLLKKEVSHDKSELTYIDIRKPSAKSFNISEDEWQQIKKTNENITGWERILEKAFYELLYSRSKWESSHTCDGDTIFKDKNSSLLKYKLNFEPYRKAINFAFFSPTPYNCQILEKIISPATTPFDTWWKRIETSKQIENNRDNIQKYIKKLDTNDMSLIGILTDGGQGLATGNNGNFVGYNSTSRFAENCKETRPQKLWEAIQVQKKITIDFPILSTCKTQDDIKQLLNEMNEQQIWELFDNIKNEYGLRTFGKGYMYRIIPEEMIFDVNKITDDQKTNGISGNQTYVPYDKGDRDGNRWYLETPYLINWSDKVVSWLKENSGHKGAGLPVVRNPQFYFRNGFCWTNVLNPNSIYFKCRLKDNTVNDVGSMSLYDECGLGDKYFVLTLNSYLHFKVLREFLNNTVNIQINDIRKLPIKIPSDQELEAFNQKFDECLAIKKKYFNGEIDKIEMNIQLKPIEVEVDDMVNLLYGIAVKEEIIEDELIEEVEVDEFEDADEND